MKFLVSLLLLSFSTYSKTTLSPLSESIFQLKVPLKEGELDAKGVGVEGVPLSWWF